MNTPLNISRRLRLDKIASVTTNCALEHEVCVADEIRCRLGDVLAVRVLTRKNHYNTLELDTGRFSKLRPGDVIAGALGHRRALVGYAGHLPDRLQVGDRVDLLNLGGVLGHVDSVNPDLGPPFSCEVIGQVLTFPWMGKRVGVPANVADGVPSCEGAPLELGGVPVIAVVGTAMNSGKTHACTALIQELVRKRLRVAAGKATGVSLKRDCLAMQDAGASWTATFTDFGVVTTTRANAADAARAILSRLAQQGPDVIVLELGDGLMGTYGVDAILDDEEVRAGLGAVLLCAHDPVGAWGGIRCLAERYGLQTDVVTGPATDNVAGTELIEERFGSVGLNARTQAEELAEHVWARARAPREA